MWAGGDDWRHGALTGASSVVVRMTSGPAVSTAIVMVEATSLPEGLDSPRWDCAQQSSAAA